jgi:uncharacterized protein YcfJ
MKKFLLILLFISSSAFANFTQVIKVEYTEPLYKTINKRVQVEDKCYERMVEKVVPCGNEKQVERNSIGLDTIFGAVAGVVIGNQIGKGNGKTTAKIVGGLGGAYGANQLRGGSKKCKVKEPVVSCVPQYETQSEKVITAYKNCGQLNKIKYCKSSNKQLENIKLFFTVKVL